MIIRLWNCYIVEGICELHENILFASLMKCTKVASLDWKFSFFNDKVARLVFIDIFCNSSLNFIRKITIAGFNCFKVYMNWINEKDQSAISSRMPDSSLKQLGTAKAELDNIEGWATLWDICFQCEIQIIREHAKEYLVSLFDKLCNKQKLKRKEITQKALATSLDNLKDLSNVAQAKIALSIIDSLIEKYFTS